MIPDSEEHETRLRESQVESAGAGVRQRELEGLQAQLVRVDGRRGGRGQQRRLRRAQHVRTRVALGQLGEAAAHLVSQGRQQTTDHMKSSAVSFRADI
jgi:hypothetical protein